MNRIVKRLLIALGVVGGVIGTLACATSYFFDRYVYMRYTYFREGTYKTKEDAVYQGILVVASISEEEFLEARGNNAVKKP